MRFEEIATWATCLLAVLLVAPARDMSSEGQLERGLPPIEEQNRVDSAGFMKLLSAYPVEGQPVFGTYGGATLDALNAAHDVEMNVVVGGRQPLDPAMPEGTYCLENGIRILYSMTGHVYGNPRLTSPITKDQAAIPLVSTGAKEIPSSGVIQLDDELIRYEARGDEGLRDCQRGFRGTTASSHHEGIHLFFPDACAADVESVKESPNLYGYYVLDDPPGDVLSGLRGMYRLIKRIDTDPNHPVCAGYSLMGPMQYFRPGVCDVMMIYIYPVRWRGYQRERISFYLQRMLMTARQRVPGIPFFGVYQAFGYPTGNHAIPNNAQLREMMEDFVREGASGLIAFTCETSRTLQGWSDYNHMTKVMRSAGQEIASTGGLCVAPEPARMGRARVQPSGYWKTPRDIQGIVPAWYVIAPFDDADDKYLDAVFPPERAIELDATYEGNSGKSSWITRPTAAGYIILNGLFGGMDVTNSVAYAACRVTSPRRQTVQMRVGTDDDAVIWLDGNEVYRHSGVRGIEEDGDIVEVELPAGESKLLVKVYNRKGEWGFFMRFTDGAGNPLDGLSFSPTANAD